MHIVCVSCACVLMILLKSDSIQLGVIELCSMAQILKFEYAQAKNK